MFVYSGLQGNSLQKAISKLLYGSLTCTMVDFSSWHRGHPVKAPIRRTAHLFSAIPANDKESVFRHYS